MQSTRGSENTTTISRNNFHHNEEDRDNSSGSGNVSSLRCFQSYLHLIGIGQAPNDLNINNRIGDHGLQHKIKSGTYEYRL